MLEIGKIYRISKKEKNPDVLEVDGLPNFFHETAIPHAGTQFEVQRGIHAFARVKGVDGRERIPAIFITSSPYKAGSEDTPWKDRFEPDHGRIKYYGDNKSSEKNPEETAGNKALLKLLQAYRSSESETRAREGVPLLYFERVTVDGRVKGNLKFHGFGIAIGAELVTQFIQKKGSLKKEYFSNYKYDFVVFSLKKEQEKFDFIKWIGARFDPNLTIEETNRFAPQSWRDWISCGSRDLSEVRRIIPGQKIVKYSDQLPPIGSVDFALLNKIYEHYNSGIKIHNFTALAIEVTRKVVESNNLTCIPGWALAKPDETQNGFVVRMDIGDDILTGIRIPIIGHAQCARPTQVINVTEVENIYKATKQGWIVAYVTTSFFSESVQLEAQTKSALLINGKQIAQIVRDELYENEFSLEEYLDLLDSRYQFSNKKPEEIISL